MAQWVHKPWELTSVNLPTPPQALHIRLSAGRWGLFESTGKLNWEERLAALGGADTLVEDWDW